MPKKLEKAPLVELVAELRWLPALSSAQDQSGAPVMIPHSLIDPSQSELFFQRFGGSVYQYGFKSVERLIPHSMPLPPDQMVCRYRQTDTNAPPVLFQVGSNQFSANALPPYKTWADFRPWIERGVQALLEAKPELPPLKVSVRYIDAFKNDLTEGMEITEFLNSVLGIGINLPRAITDRMRGPGKIKTAVSATIPFEGMQMTIKAGEGIIGGEVAAILDTQVSLTLDVAPKLDSVMNAMDAARKVIHDSFMELVLPIMSKLEPVEA